MYFLSKIKFIVIILTFFAACCQLIACSKALKNPPTYSSNPQATSPQAIGTQADKKTNSSDEFEDKGIRQNTNADQAIRRVSDILIAPVQTEYSARELILDPRHSQMLESEFVQAFRLYSKLEVSSVADIEKNKQASVRLVDHMYKFKEHELFRLARDNSISSLLLIRVNKLQDRSGSSFGSNSLAQLGLSAEIFLSDSYSDTSNTIAPIWKSDFEYSDTVKPLISFEDGKLASLGFKSIDQLVARAANQIAQEFVAARNKSFIKK